MKRLLRYYLFLERGILTLFLTLVYIFLIVVAILMVQSTYALSDSVYHYYYIRDKDQSLCLESQKSSLDPSHRYEWRDKTFLGFGEESSYGCFLVIETPVIQTPRRSK